MKKVTITLFAFSELTKEAQQKALVENRTINAGFGWWLKLEQEAKDLQIHIKRFDIEKDIPSAIGYVFGACTETARLLMKKYGSETYLYKIADTFLKQHNSLNEQAENANDKGIIKELSNLILVNERVFVTGIMECYAYLLKSEYYERVTDESVIKTFEENEYTFEKDGRINNTRSDEQENIDGAWGFVEKYYPNYSSSDAIAHADD